MNINRDFLTHHLINELGVGSRKSPTALSEKLIELALGHIIDSIESTNGNYDDLPIEVRELVSKSTYDMCYMTDKELYEYENCVIGSNYIDNVDDSDKQIIIVWPFSQKIDELDPNNEYHTLINDERGLRLYGSAAYFVNYHWYLEIQSKL